VIKCLLQRVIEWMDMVTLFLILVSKIMMTVFSSDETLKMSSLSLLQWDVLLSLEQQFTLWNNIWLEKVSITLSPRRNSLFRESKDGKTPLIWLLALTMELLIFCYCLKVIYFKEKQWSWERCVFSLKEWFDHMVLR